jgi:hypothetical protein
LGLLAPLAFVFLLPTVIAVQRANADVQGQEALAANSRFTPLSWAAMAFGGVVWLAYLLAVTA